MSASMDDVGPGFRAVSIMAIAGTFAWGLFGWLGGCSRSTATTSHNMTCEGIQIPRVGSGDGLRCENDEAVCYGTPGGALSCWGKP